MAAQVDINVLVSGLSSANQGLQNLTQQLQNISQAAINLSSATKAFKSLQDSVSQTTIATKSATESVSKVNNELGEQQQLSSEAASANIQFANAVKQATLALSTMVTDGLLKVGAAFSQIAIKQERYVKSLRSVSKDAA